MINYKNIITKKITVEKINGKTVGKEMLLRLDERVRAKTLTITSFKEDHYREYRLPNGVLFCTMERYF